jgi:hypothetical protein
VLSACFVRLPSADFIKERRFYRFERFTQLEISVHLSNQ